VTRGDTKRAQEGKARLRGAAISALLSASTIQGAARKAGISKRTLLRWLRDPVFRSEYSQAKGDALKMATAILVRNSSRAAVTLGEIFSNKWGRENQAARVSAAALTLKLAQSAIEMEDFDARLRALEEQSHGAY